MTHAAYIRNPAAAADLFPPMPQLEAARQAAAASLASEPPQEWVDRFNGAPRKGCDILVQVRTAGWCFCAMDPGGCGCGWTASIAATSWFRCAQLAGVDDVAVCHGFYFACVVRCASVQVQGGGRQEEEARHAARVEQRMRVPSAQQQVPSVGAQQRHGAGQLASGTEQLASGIGQLARQALYLACSRSAITWDGGVWQQQRQQLGRRARGITAGARSLCPLGRGPWSAARGHAVCLPEQLYMRCLFSFRVFAPPSFSAGPGA